MRRKSPGHSPVDGGRQRGGGVVAGRRCAAWRQAGSRAIGAAGRRARQRGSGRRRKAGGEGGHSQTEPCRNHGIWFVRDSPHVICRAPRRPSVHVAQPPAASRCYMRGRRRAEAQAEGRSGADGAQQGECRRQCPRLTQQCQRRVFEVAIWF